MTHIPALPLLDDTMPYKIRYKWRSEQTTKKQQHNNTTTQTQTQTQTQTVRIFPSQSKALSE